MLKCKKLLAFTLIVVTFMTKKNSILFYSEPKNAEFRAIFILMSI